MVVYVQKAVEIRFDDLVPVGVVHFSDEPST